MKRSAGRKFAAKLAVQRDALENVSIAAMSLTVTQGSP